MHRRLAALAAFVPALFAAAAFAPSAAAQATATVTLLHGVPGAPVDVVVDGAVVVPTFQPGTTQDLSSFAGQTLRNVEVRAAGTSTVVIGPVASLAVPSSGNWTLVAHLGASGTPTLTPFQNDTSPVAAGQGRLTVRHTAAAPAVDIVLADGSRPFTNLTNPNSVSADLPAGPISGAKIAPTGAAPIADVPAVDLRAGTNLIVYAVGSAQAGTLGFLTQTVSGLGGTPTAVNSGDSVPAREGNGLVLPSVVAAAVVALGGAFGLRRRLAS